MRSCFPRTLLTFSALAALHPVTALHAQTPLLATPSVRITAAAVPGATVTLKGNTHPLAQAKYDAGAADPSLATGRLQLLLRRSPAQQAALDQYMGSLGDPNSPNYRKWLTPAQFGASFGVADQDLQTVQVWLQGQGFKIEAVPASRNYVQFSGNLGQVAQAFHTSVHSYDINGERHLSNATDPQIPAAFAGVVAGVSPLNDFRAKPLHVPGGQRRVISRNGSLQTAAPAGAQTAQGATSQLTFNDSNNNPFLLLTPADAATIYNAPNAFNRNFTGTTQQTGAGVNIGIAGDSNFPTADYLNYRHLFLNDTGSGNLTVVTDGTDPGTTGDAIEALLDTELSAGLAPQAGIVYYQSASSTFVDGVYSAALRAVQDNSVSVLSISYGQCEFNLGQAGNLQLSALYQQAAAQGITVVVASGDSGSAGCDLSAGETQATGGLAVSGFASTPYNVAVGGTDFDVLPSNFAQYVNGTANGSSAPYYRSALGYIPENPWNDSIGGAPGPYSADVAKQYTLASGGTTTILAAGGGGASSAVFCSGPLDANGNCNYTLTGYKTPSFQSGITTGTGIPTGVRYIPDVALFASAGNQHQAGWAICGDNVIEGTSTSAIDCVPATDGSFSVYRVGGTSAAAPAFAGVLAQVIQALPNHQRLGLANGVLYNLAATHGSIFHDITLGNNSVPCATSTAANPDPNCGSNNFLTGYNAGTGYDLATGLGSFDVSALVAGWSTAAFTPTTTALQVNGGTAPVSFQHGTAISLSANVTPPSATGDVAVTATNTGQGGAAVTETISLTSGSGTISPVTNLPGGSYNVQAYYQGDVTHSPSTSSPAIAITISPEASSPFLSLAIIDLANPGTIQTNATLTTATYGELGYAYIQPENANAINTGVGSHGVATGSASLLNGGTSLGTQALNSQGVTTFPLYNLTPGTYSFSARYSGDGSYNPSTTASPIPLRITKAITSLKVGAGSTTLAASASTNVTVELDTDSAGQYPTGSVTLTGNGTTFTGTMQKGTLSSGAVAELYTFAVPGSALAAGSNTLTATYAGDGNYNGSSGTVGIVISGGSGTSAGFALSGPANGITVASPGQQGTGTVTITPTNGFAGAVSLTCQVKYSGVGASPTCAVPASVTLTGGNAATATVTVSTTQASWLHAPAYANPGSGSRWLFAGAGGALCSVLLWGIPARRKKWRGLRAAAAVLFALISLGALGCGSSTNGSSSNGTSTGSYSLVVTGTSGSTTANTQITLAVQ